MMQIIHLVFDPVEFFKVLPIHKLRMQYKRSTSGERFRCR